MGLVVKPKHLRSIQCNCIRCIHAADFEGDSESESDSDDSYDSVDYSVDYDYGNDKEVDESDGGDANDYSGDSDGGGDAAADDFIDGDIGNEEKDEADGDDDVDDRCNFIEKYDTVHRNASEPNQAFEANQPNFNENRHDNFNANDFENNYVDSDDEGEQDRLVFSQFELKQYSSSQIKDDYDDYGDDYGDEYENEYPCDDNDAYQFIYSFL